MENESNQSKSNVFEMSDWDPGIGMSPARIEERRNYDRSRHPSNYRDVATVLLASSVSLEMVTPSNVILFPSGRPHA